MKVRVAPSDTTAVLGVQRWYRGSEWKRMPHLGREAEERRSGVGGWVGVGETARKAVGWGQRGAGGPAGSAAGAHHIYAKKAWTDGGRCAVRA